MKPSRAKILRRITELLASKAKRLANALPQKQKKDVSIGYVLLIIDNLYSIMYLAHLLECGGIVGYPHSVFS